MEINVVKFHKLKKVSEILETSNRSNLSKWHHCHAALIFIFVAVHLNAGLNLWIFYNCMVHADVCGY